MYGFWGFSSSFIRVIQKTWRHKKHKSQGNVLRSYKRSLVSCFSISFSCISLILKILKKGIILISFPSYLVLKKANYDLVGQISVKYRWLSSNTFNRLKLLVMTLQFQADPHFGQDPQWAKFWSFSNMVILYIVGKLILSWSTLKLDIWG